MPPLPPNIDDDICGSCCCGEAPPNVFPLMLKMEPLALADAPPNGEVDVLFAII